MSLRLLVGVSLFLAGCGGFWHPEPRLPFPDLYQLRGLPYEDCMPDKPVLCLPLSAVEELERDREKLAALRDARQRLLDGGR